MVMVLKRAGAMIRHFDWYYGNNVLFKVFYILNRLYFRLKWIFLYAIKTLFQKILLASSLLPRYF